MITLAATRQAAVTVLAVDGRLTMASAGRLTEAIGQSVGLGAPYLVVDLTGTTFVDSSGLGALVAGLRRARESHGDLRIVAPGAQVAAALTLTNLHRVLPAYPTVAAARDGW